MTTVPEFAQDLILEFIPACSRIGISKRIDSDNLNKIRNAKFLIRRVIYNWGLDYKEEMNYDHIQFSKLVYKRFYPMYLRKTFIESALDYLADDQLRLVNKFEFNEIIDELTEEELDEIGWD